MTSRTAPTAILAMVSIVMASRLAVAGIAERSCPPQAIPVTPGAPVQAIVDRAGPGAMLCLRNGVYRGQTIRPAPGQSFIGEGRAILNGTVMLTGFRREPPYWVADWPGPSGKRYGPCARNAPACNLPEGLFVDDRPLNRVMRKNLLSEGNFFLDNHSRRVFIAEDPAGRRVEATVRSVAFDGSAPGVAIRNLVIEKYASPAQRGAIQAETPAAVGWKVQDCEIRLNSGAGVALGRAGRVTSSDIHHNGQIGITGSGDDVRIEGNRVWMNNTRNFDYRWEGGGIKIIESANAVFRANIVHDNIGPGIWCDINCRNALIEANAVESNRGAGIMYEISFGALVRNNFVRMNGLSDRSWFGGINILVAGSEEVQVTGNYIVVQTGGCGVMLLDQNRAGEGSRLRSHYTTRNNSVTGNTVTFTGSGCIGGISDAWPGQDNYSIIDKGDNWFDQNEYNIAGADSRILFPWGHATLDWAGFRRSGLEPDGKFIQP